MWREAFESVADDVDRISREVSKKVAEDPLASIGMAAPAPKKKNMEKLTGASSLATKRRRKEEQDREVAVAAALDPFARRKTRPKSYWAVGNELESPTEVRFSKRTAAYHWRFYASFLSISSGRPTCTTGAQLGLYVDDSSLKDLLVVHGLTWYRLAVFVCCFFLLWRLKPLRMRDLPRMREPLPLPQPLPGSASTSASRASPRTRALTS